MELVEIVCAVIWGTAAMLLLTQSSASTKEYKDDERRNLR